jgi:hypothetical protein
MSGECNVCGEYGHVEYEHCVFREEILDELAEMIAARRWSKAWKRAAKKHRAGWEVCFYWWMEMHDAWEEQRALIRQIFDICQDTPEADDYKSIDSVNNAITEIHGLIQEYME